MKKGLLFVLLSISACGGARIPNQNINATAQSVFTLSSNSSISWQAPSTYSDQTPLALSDIGGYHIYVGTDYSNMRLSSNIVDPSITEFRLNSIGKGIRFIAVTCYDIKGSESHFSSIVTVNII